MRIAARVKRLTVAMLPALALVCALSVAAATAHGDGHARSWHEGFRDNRAVVKGTITSVGTGSFGANAYVVTPGAGNATVAPAATAVTITVASTTKVVTAGHSGLAVGDTFYALYRDVRDSTPLSTLAGDTPTAVYAFVAPAPQVEVKGVVTAAPTSGSDSFTATTFVVAQRQSAPVGGGRNDSRGGDHSGDARRGHDLPASSNPATAGAPNTTITTDANTKITLNGQSSSVSNLAVGDIFVAIYNGTPSQALSTITATPALTVRAWTVPAGDSLYAFVGTVSGGGSGGITVNVTSSFPTGLFSGADSFTVGSQTKVLGNTKLATGDVVAGGLIAPSGESATTVGSTPLQVLVDFAPSTASSSTTTSDQLKRAEHRALEMLHREQARMDRHHDKHGTHRK